MRRAFTVLTWNPEVSDAGQHAAALSGRVAADPTWREQAAGDSTVIWTSSSSALPVRPLAQGGGWVIGDLFDMPDAGPSTLQHLEGATARQHARQLSRAHWGSYVAVFLAPGGGSASVYRDPSGLLEAFIWSLGPGVDMIASDPFRVPAGLRPRWPRLNWDRIAAFLAAPAATTTAPLFDDMVAVGPGDLLELKAPHRRAPIWTPADFAIDPIQDVAGARRAVVARVDAATAALVRPHDRILVEVSGGLDSSVLAGAIGAEGLTPHVAEWLTFSDLRPEGDETRYARAVTARLAAPLVTLDHVPHALVEADLADLAAAVWPAMDGMDANRDRAEVARLQRCGATAILSGEGGDGAFFQMPSALVADDALQRGGLTAIGGPVFADVARRTRQSVWSVLAQVMAARRGRGRRPLETLTLLTPDLAAASLHLQHDWVRDAAMQRLPLGKRQHIQAIANLHLNHGPSRRRAAADLLFPLMSQPVLELCLAIATPDLAGGSYDRPFQRQAFADRVPPEVLGRRAKGNLAVYFSKLVANSLPLLRPYLLDGCLCEAGLLSRSKLDQVLNADQLIWSATATDVLWAASVEAWVRYWQTQVPDSLAAPRASPISEVMA